MEDMLTKQGLKSMKLIPPLIDVRVAQFLITPDSPSVRDSPELQDERERVTFPNFANFILYTIPYFKLWPEEESHLQISHHLQIN